MVKKEVAFLPGYPLRYGWEGLEKLTSALNAEAFEDFEKIVNKIGPKHIRIILWAGLIHKDPDISTNEVYNLIDTYLENHTMSDLSELIGKALAISGILGGSDPGEEKTVATKKLKPPEISPS